MACVQARNGLLYQDWIIIQFMVDIIVEEEGRIIHILIQSANIFTIQ